MGLISFISKQLLYPTVKEGVQFTVGDKSIPVFATLPSSSIQSDRWYVQQMFCKCLWFILHENNHALTGSFFF